MDLFKLIAAKRLEVSNLVSEVEAISTLAEKEKRDITAVEKTRMEEITNADGLLTTHSKEITNLEARLAVLEEAKRVMAPRLNAQIAASQLASDGSDDSDVIANIKIPARARRSFDSKAFTNEREAYAAGQWCMATIGQKPKAKQWCIDNGVMNAQSEGVNTAGGYLVPEFFETSIIRIVESYGVFRQNAYVYPMGSDTVKVPRRTSGYTVYYVGENATITASDMAFNQIALVAKKAAILTQISNELNEDEVVGLAGLMSQEFGYALALAEDQAGFIGDGTSTYGGIQGLVTRLAAGSISTAASSQTAFSTLTLASFNKAKGLLPQYNGAVNRWYISKQGFAQSMELLAVAAGGITTREIASGMQQTFLGDPVVFSQVLPITGAAQASAIVAYYGDLRMAATMGTRRQMNISSDSSIYFKEDAIAVRCTERFDINVHGIGTSTVAGPLIALKMAAS